MPRPKTGPHFQDNASDTPDIGFTTITIWTANNLRCHPINSSLHRSSIIVVGIDVTCKRISQIYMFGGERTAVLRNAKVGYFADSFQIDEDIIGFEISVQDVSRM